MTRLLNIGKDRLNKIPKDAPLVSISDAYSSAPEIPNRQNRPILFLSFFPGDHFQENTDPERLFTKEKGQQVVAFCEEHRKAGADAIYIQCGEGRIRSYTLCTLINQMEGYQHDHANSSVQRGVIDRVTARMLGEVVDPIVYGE
ncbi:hypothetical protein D9M68_19750 [compost metagenome]